jgi:hypothetical protein
MADLSCSPKRVWGDVDAVETYSFCRKGATLKVGLRQLAETR